MVDIWKFNEFYINSNIEGNMKIMEKYTEFNGKDDIYEQVYGMHGTSVISRWIRLMYVCIFYKFIILFNLKKKKKYIHIALTRILF